MKRILGLAIVFGLFMASFCYGSQDIKITVDGNTIESDTPAQIVEGRTLVPLRAIFEAIGAEVSWNSEEKSISAAKDDTSIYMKIDDTSFRVNDDEKELDVAAAIIDGRTMVPARAVSESLGCDVSWDSETRTVIVTTKKADVTEVTTEETIVTVTEKVTETTTAAKEYKVKYESGTYTVGKDFPYGQYVFFAEEGKVGQVIANDMETTKRNGEYYINNKAEHYVNDRAVISIKDSGKKGQNVKSAYFDYKQDNDELYLFSEIQLIDCYAVPIEYVDDKDKEFKSLYRVGVDIPAGDYTFKRAEGCEFAVVEIVANGGAANNLPYVIEEKSVLINLKSGMIVQIVNCDVEKDGTPYIIDENNGYRDDIDMDFSKITYTLKNTVCTDIRAITQGTKSSASLEKIKDSWGAMVKNDEDKKYIEIMYSAVDKYVKARFESTIVNQRFKGIDNKMYNYNDVDKNLLDKNAPDYEPKMEAIENHITNLNRVFGKLASAESFNELQEICYSLNAFIV